MVVTEVHGRVLGLLVDAVAQVLKVPSDLVVPPPDECRSIEADYITGVARSTAGSSSFSIWSGAAPAGAVPHAGAWPAKVDQTIRDWTIRRKILSGFAVVLLLSGAARLARHPGTGSASPPPWPPASRPERRAQLFRDYPRPDPDDLGITIVLGFAGPRLAQLIADPLKKLGLLAEEVAKGDLTTDIRSQSRDEIGWLEH